MIRNYENPEDTIALIDSTSVTIPVKVFTSSTNGSPLGTSLPAGHPEGPGVSIARDHAVTTIAFCNTAAPSTADETANAVIVNVYIVRRGKSHGAGNLIVSNLTVPAGETVFFSEERMVLLGGDEIWVGTSAASRLSVTVSTLPV
jgi:hypothetical protein